MSRAEGLLLQAQRKQREGNHAEVASLLEEVYTLLPHRAPEEPSAKVLSQKLDLCQVQESRVCRIKRINCGRCFLFYCH